MSLPKVLVGICTYDGKAYCWEDFRKNIESFQYPNYDVMVVDNGRGNKFARKMRRESDFIVKHNARSVNSRVGHAKSLNTIRDYFLAEDYDYLLLLESDVLPPVDIIERLLVCGHRVVGSLYYIGHPGDPRRKPHPCLFKQYGAEIKGLSAEEGWSMFGTGVQEVHGCGIGCTLVERSVIEEFRFWWNLDNPPKHSDVLFYMDLANAKIPVFVNTDVIVRHLPSDWDHVKDI